MGIFGGVLVAEQPFENIEAVGPEALIMSEPFVRAGERAGIEPADMGAAAHLAPDQAGMFERLDVLGRRRQRDGEGLGELAHRPFAVRKRAQHATSCGVAKRVEDGVELRGFKFNHMVEYAHAELESQPIG